MKNLFYTKNKGLELHTHYSDYTLLGYTHVWYTHY